MDAFKLEAFKVALFILPGIITLRIKTALSISSPSKPLNTVIDGLAFTRVDHALFGILKATLNAVCHYPIAKGIKSLAASIIATSSLPGELGQAFGDAGGFPIIVIAVVTGFVGEIDTFSEEAGNMRRRSRSMARCFRFSGRECCLRERIPSFAWNCGTRA